MISSSPITSPPLSRQAPTLWTGYWRGSRPESALRSPATNGIPLSAIAPASSRPWRPGRLGRSCPDIYRATSPDQFVRHKRPEVADKSAAIRRLGACQAEIEARTQVPGNGPVVPSASGRWSAESSSASVLSSPPTVAARAKARSRARTSAARTPSSDGSPSGILPSLSVSMVPSLTAMVSVAQSWPLQPHNRRHDNSFSMYVGGLGE